MAVAILDISRKLILTHLSEQNGRHLADNLFRRIFMNEKVGILIEISLNFVPKGPIDNKSVLVQVMAWRWIGDKPLSEPMLTQFTDAPGGTRGRWVKVKCSENLFALN